MDWGDIECAGLSVDGRRLHLCGEGAVGVPGRGLHLLRLGDCGLRRASNSIDRFNVAPQAMIADLIRQWTKPTVKQHLYDIKMRRILFQNRLSRGFIALRSLSVAPPLTVHRFKHKVPDL